MGIWDDRVRERIVRWLSDLPEMRQDRLGEAVGWKQSSVSGYLNGSTGAQLDTIAAFMRIIRRPMSDLFQEDEPAPLLQHEAEAVATFYSLSDDDWALVEQISSRLADVRPRGEARKSWKRPASRGLGRARKLGPG